MMNSLNTTSLSFSSSSSAVKRLYSSSQSEQIETPFRKPRTIQAESSNNKTEPSVIKQLKWNRHFAALLSYFRDYGTCNVPGQRVYECDLPELGEEGGVYHYKANLGDWLAKQRKAKKGKAGYKIFPDQLSQMQVLVDMGKLAWSLENTTNCQNQNTAVPVPWSIQYAALLEYFNQHGTCNVPQSHVYECDLPEMGEDGGAYHYKANLGRWLRNQRSAKKGQDGRTITPARLALLQQLVDEGKLAWSLENESASGLMKKKYDEDWLYHYAALLAFCNQHGTCNVPQSHVYECDLPEMGEDGGAYHYKANLGRWLRNQKYAKRGQDGRTITPERLALLQQLVDEGKLAWPQETDSEEKRNRDVQRELVPWSRQYAALLEYFNQHGTCNVPQSHEYECDLLEMTEEGGVYHYKANLGRWLRNQRSAKKGQDGRTITPARLALLQQLVDEGKMKW